MVLCDGAVEHDAQYLMTAVRADRIDPALSERGQCPPPHVERIRLPHRGLPAFGEVGEERPREGPHRGDGQGRAVSRRRVGDQRARGVPRVLDVCRRLVQVPTRG